MPPVTTPEGLHSTSFAETNQPHTETPKEAQGLDQGLDQETKSIEALREMIRLCSDADPALILLLEELAVGLNTQFYRTPSLQHNTEWLEAMQKLVGLAGEGHEELPAFLGGLGMALLERNALSSDAEVVYEAISVLQKAVQLAGNGHTGLPGMYHNLACALRARFSQRRDVEDINLCIVNARLALETIPAGHREVQTCMCTLGNALLYRFEANNDFADLEESISTLEKALAINGGNPLTGLDTLTMLRRSYLHRARATQPRSYVDEAIFNLRSEAHTLLEGQPDFSDVSGHLGHEGVSSTSK